MPEPCSDCGGEVQWMQPTRSGTGLPVKLVVDDGAGMVEDGSTVRMDGLACGDCGRIRLRSDLPVDGEADGAGECPACGGPTVTGRVGGSGFTIHLVDYDAERGSRRSGLTASACTDCGAVALDAADVTAHGDEVTCVACDGRMSLTDLEADVGSLLFVGEGGDVVAGRDRADPVGWACEDCGLTLLYDRNTD